MNTFDFAGHMVSVAAVLLCPSSKKEANRNYRVWQCPAKLQGVWPPGGPCWVAEDEPELLAHAASR